MIPKTCKNCEERHPLCHGDCEKYAAYRAELELVNAERTKSQPIGIAMRDFKKKYYKGTIRSY